MPNLSLLADITGGENMLGFEGVGVFWAYVLSILAAALCVVYGIINWNKTDENEAKEVIEEKKWEKKDSKLKSKI
jgi:hypothetical protein